MNKILLDSDASKLPPNSVLAGGCFDVIHSGHLEFLEKSKSLGEKLCLLLESDESIRDKKGKGRPLNNQSVRAENLSKLDTVDYIILLKKSDSSLYYYNLVKLLHPAIIAVTVGDPLLELKTAQAALVGGRVVEVMKRNTLHSTTKILNKKI